MPVPGLTLAASSYAPQACNVVVDFGHDPTSTHRARLKRRHMSELVLELDGEFTQMVNALESPGKFQQPTAQRWALLAVSAEAASAHAQSATLPSKKRKVPP